MSEATRWFMLHESGELRDVGLYADIDEADKAVDYSAVWLIDEDTARDWHEFLCGRLEHG